MGGLLWWGRRDLPRLWDLNIVMAVVCFVLTFVVAFISVIKWKIALKRLGHMEGLVLGSLLHYFLLGRTLGLLLPVDFTDFAVRSASLKVGHSVPVGSAAYSIYFDRIFDIIVGGTLVVPSMLFIFGKIDFFTGLYFSAILLVMSFFILKIQSKRVLSLIKGLFEFGMKVISNLPWLGKHFVLPDERLRSSEGLVKMMVWMYLLSLVKLIFNALRFVVIAEAIGLSINSSDLMLFFPGAQLASVLSFTPGGLGITDWSWGGLLYAMGVSKAEIVPYLVSFRLVISASLVALLGISTLFYGRVGSRG